VRHPQYFPVIDILTLVRSGVFYNFVCEILILFLFLFTSCIDWGIFCSCSASGVSIRVFVNNNTYPVFSNKVCALNSRNRGNSRAGIEGYCPIHSVLYEKTF